jgi:hypothetical protein
VESIDKAIHGMVSESSGRNESERNKLPRNPARWAKFRAAKKKAA